MRFWLSLCGLLAVGLAACSSAPPLYHQEHFNVSDLYSRVYSVSPPAACDAARRALLGQGYLVGSVEPDGLKGRKSFQQDAKTHVEIELHVVCVPAGSGGSTVFVNALHDRYALKQSVSSASLGAGPVGSFSVPFGSSDDAMVKVASETITARNCYERFFALLERSLPRDSALPAARPGS